MLVRSGAMAASLSALLAASTAARAQDGLNVPSWSFGIGSPTVGRRGPAGVDGGAHCRILSERQVGGHETSSSSEAVRRLHEECVRSLTQDDAGMRRR
jgi:hypothetical protein